MAVDRRIQEILDLIEALQDGYQARTTSNFAVSRSKGSNPHVGLDVNRGRKMTGGALERWTPAPPKHDEARKDVAPDYAGRRCGVRHRLNVDGAT